MDSNILMWAAFCYLLIGIISLHLPPFERVIWKEDTLTQEAIAVLDEIMNDSGDLIVRRSLKPGEGLICANVPHRRDAFIDSSCVGERRLMYRGRYNHPLGI